MREFKSGDLFIIKIIKKEKKMKKIKLIFISLLAIFGIVTLAGCSSKDDNTDELEAKIAELEEANSTLTEENDSLKQQNSSLESELAELKKKAAFEIKVTDIDGEVLGDKTLVAGNYDTVYNALDDNFEVVATSTAYGHYLVSINNSVVDSNYYMAIYENGEAALTGIDGLEINPGDLFEFKVECLNTIAWGGTFDEYDILVDKAFYHYAKTYMKDFNASSTVYNDSNYWNYMLNNLMISNNYDSNLFKTLTNESVKASLESQDLTALSGENIAKYYWAAKSYNLDLTSFKTEYQTIINNISTTYSDYVTPFVISPAKSLNITSDNLTNLITNASAPSTQYGTDALVWQIACLAMFDKYTSADVLSSVITRNVDYGCISVAITLQDYAALNVSPRQTSYEVDGKDVIEFLFDEFYDAELGYFKVYKTDTEISDFSNQIYASLAAYKVQRDKGTAAYLYA